MLGQRYIHLETDAGIVVYAMILPCFCQHGFLCIGFIIVPRIVNADTTQQVEVYRIYILLAEQRTHIQHQVEIGIHIFVVISEILVGIIISPLVPDTIDMQTSTDNGSKPSAEIHRSRWGNQLQLVIIGECSLCTTLHTDKHVRERFIIHVTILWFLRANGHCTSK